MNALPWANIDAAFTHNAFALINVNELLWLYSLCKVVGIHFNELILVRPQGHRWIGVGLCHGN